jgi:hypothetical protein
MKLTFRSQTFFPFLVPTITDPTLVGPQTVYPVGLSLDHALQIYWRAQNYQLTATGNGVLGPLTQALSVDELIPPRNASVGTDSYYEVDGFVPAGPGDLVTGWGVRIVVPGTGSVTADGDGVTGSNPDAAFNLQINLFYPEFFAPDPVVIYDGKWWPAMSVSCATSNPVELDGGGELSIGYDCSSFDPGDTTEIGSFSFFGVSVPVYCSGLEPASSSDPAETRSFSGAITVANEFP